LTLGQLGPKTAIKREETILLTVSVSFMSIALISREMKRAQFWWKKKKKERKKERKKKNRASALTIVCPA